MRPARTALHALALAAVLLTHPARALAADDATANAASAPEAASAAGVTVPEATAPAASAAASQAAVQATAQQPRSFGHVIGDVLTQRVLLEQQGRGVEPAGLPPADRVGLFLERRTPRIERDEAGRRWLAIDYQVVNAPRALTAATLPALALPTTAGTTLSVPAWPISLGPLTPPAAFGQGDLLPLRPDRAVAPVSTLALERQLKAALGALAALLLLWAAWWAWRNWREAQRLPFARAWHRLRRLDEASPEAWLAVHQALNATAGRTVHGTSLPRLLAEAPHLQPLQGRLQEFFLRSSARFFAVGPTPSTDRFALRELGRALREAERRQRA